MKRKWIVSAVLLLGILMTVSAYPQEEEGCVFTCNKKETPKLIITRVGKIEAEPDKAAFNVDIRAEETKVDKATDKNVDRINAIIGILAQNGVEKKDIKTTNYNISPMYEGKPLFSKIQRPTSYVVTQGLRVNVYKLDTIGKMLSKISENDYINVYGLSFTSTKLEELKNEALKLAAKSARETALAVVEAAGGKLGNVLRIEESSAGVPFRREIMAKADFRMAEMADRGVSEAEVEAGTLEVQAYCTITYQIDEK